MRPGTLETMPSKKKQKQAAQAGPEEDVPASDVAAVDDEEERIPIQVETGDFVKVKQTLDESVVKAVLMCDFVENHYWDNVKLALMVVACAFAMVAQFYPMPFPESRPLLGICCCAYFLASFVLQLIVTYIEQDCIMITQPKAGVTALGLRIRTNFPRFQYDYQLTIQEQNPSHKSAGDSTNAVKRTFLVHDYFTEDGWFDDEAFEGDVMKAVRAFASKKSS